MADFSGFTVTPPLILLAPPPIYCYPSWLFSVKLKLLRTVITRDSFGYTISKDIPKNKCLQKPWQVNIKICKLILKCHRFINSKTKQGILNFYYVRKLYQKKRPCARVSFLRKLQALSHFYTP